MGKFGAGWAAHRDAWTKADVLAEHGRIRDFLPKLSQHADAYTAASRSLHEAMSALADDFAEVIGDAALQGAAAQLRGAGRTFADAQASTLSQLLLLPFLRELQGPADLDPQAILSADPKGAAAQKLAAAGAEAAAEEPRLGAGAKITAEPRPAATFEGFDDLIGPLHDAQGDMREGTAVSEPRSAGKLWPKASPASMPVIPDLLDMSSPPCSGKFDDSACGSAHGGAATEGKPTEDAQDRPGIVNASIHAEEDVEATELHVQQWRQGKGIRALLASLHEVVPAGSRWEPMALGDLLEPAAVKEAWKRAALAVHPDKISQKVLGRLVFDALMAAMEDFRREG